MMDLLSVVVGGAAASLVWGGVFAVARRDPRKPRQCIAEWWDRHQWVCTKLAHPNCRSLRCRHHCKSDLCGCLTEDRIEAEVLKELRAATKEKSR